jgi:hypothetical protein
MTKLLTFPERWENIPDFNGYQISDWGRIRSISRTVLTERYFCNGLHVQGRILKTHINRDGYVCIMLFKKILKIHRLVGAAFVANPGNKPKINHGNGNKADNYYKNLSWTTHAENIQHAYDTGLIPLKAGGKFRKAS